MCCKFQKLNSSTLLRVIYIFSLKTISDDEDENKDLNKWMCVCLLFQSIYSFSSKILQSFSK